MKKEEIMGEDYEIIGITDNFPPTHDEIEKATRKKDGPREHYWIKVAKVLPTPEGMAETTLIIKKKK